MKELIVVCSIALAVAIGSAVWGSHMWAGLVIFACVLLGISALAALALVCLALMLWGTIKGRKGRDNE